MTVARWDHREHSEDLFDDPHYAEQRAKLDHMARNWAEQLRDDFFAARR